jgi:hypothetical protein
MSGFDFRQAQASNVRVSGGNASDPKRVTIARHSARSRAAMYSGGSSVGLGSADSIASAASIAALFFPRCRMFAPFGKNAVYTANPKMRPIIPLCQFAGNADRPSGEAFKV